MNCVDLPHPRRRWKRLFVFKIALEGETEREITFSAPAPAATPAKPAIACLFIHENSKALASTNNPGKPRERKTMIPCAILAVDPLT
jgi:hypothetical protein